MGLLLYYGGHGHSHGSTSSASHQESIPVTLNPTTEQTTRTNSNEVNINVRAAFIHVIGDMIQSIGVLIAALIILWDVSLASY